MVAGKLIRHLMMLHNNIGFNSKGSEEIAKNCWVLPPNSY